MCVAREAELKRKRVHWAGWKKGKEMKRDKMTGVATIETQRGKVVEFRSENHCSWDPTHEDPNHIVDDVAASGVLERRRCSTICGGDL